MVENDELLCGYLLALSVLLHALHFSWVRFKRSSITGPNLRCSPSLTHMRIGPRRLSNPIESHVPYGTFHHTNGLQSLPSPKIAFPQRERDILARMHLLITAAAPQPRRSPYSLSVFAHDLVISRGRLQLPLKPMHHA